MKNNNILSIKNLSKLYGVEKSRAFKMKSSGVSKDEIYKKTGVTVALWDVTFDVKKGEMFVIIGLSGSGKSTLVRCFNMLNKPSSGEILFNDKDISKFNKKELNEYRRNNIAMVFQNFGLMSHRDVLGNVEYGLEIKGVSKEERQAKAREMISMVCLEGLENEPISSLSGGMKQRVGLARALANDPDILLMDEPFSALDPLVRKDMQFELLSIQKKLDKTIIFITHDINEAFKLGDRVAIMRDGELIQLDTPEMISEHPANDYVKQFINDADKTQVISVRNVMATPNSIVRRTDSLSYAINIMRSNRVSSAYVVGDKMKLLGIVTIDDAVRARNEKLSLSDVIIESIMTTAPDTLLHDIIPMAAETRYPIAVIDNDGSLKGILSKADVLSSIL
ncbi:glycine betaine/L-proline ABC transporter ATP-binding protein [Tissierella carlieri]|uniref:Quaternary amine transport ATP-binding protein n=1 Tax=Tissierella carlieri TaxID=689904 RepID=A0ABT1S6K6_9FIRM|nr:glycine betaine/L-proline ABC transporter ATP-binding protein [Tissierella carlieri]MBU5314432.1 glycine betaine/L-proline ABC transporter ATP-binding protein [Tissierella carlieri]MCQ4922094.1 glycine betaine/L-proline ABC transporter ATP-binding protein [Tissierella carlieri]